MIYGLTKSEQIQESYIQLSANIIPHISGAPIIRKKFVKFENRLLGLVGAAWANAVGIKFLN